MDRDRKIEQEVAQTLECLGQQEQPLKGDPYFYTRVMARIRRLERQEEQPSVFRIATRVLRPSYLFIIIALNILTVTVYLSGGDTVEQSRDQVISAFLAESVQELVISN